MADKKFGVKQINLIGASGTPTLTSPNNLNINAVNVAISTDVSVGGDITLSGRIQASASSNLKFGNADAGSGSTRNIAIGDQVLFSLSGGTGRNISIGELSYYDTTTGSYNIGLGIRAGEKITTGSYNVIIGGYNGQTGLDLRTSSNNVVIADGEGNIRQYIDSSGNVGIKTTTVPEALTVSGIVSATSFYGTLNADQLTGVLPSIDGSNLFGITAAGSGVQVRDSGSIVGTAATIDFGTNLDVSFASGIATVGVSSVTEATNAYGLAGNPLIDVYRLTVDALDPGLDSVIYVGTGITISSLNGILLDRGIRIFGNNRVVDFVSDTLNIDYESGLRWFETDSGNPLMNLDYNGGNNNDTFGQLEIKGYNNSTLQRDTIAVFDRLSRVGIGSTQPTSKLTVTGDTLVSGVVTATSFSGSGANLTSLPAGQLTGTLPAIDGSALLNINATGSGIVVENNAVNVGSARTVNFGTGLDVTYSSSGIATITSSAGGSLQSRTIVNGITTAIVNNGIGNTDITGFKAYSLMKVGLSTAAWLRLYTDSASRANDTSRSVGEDPVAGSGVIAEVVTTGVSTSQIISPFVMGGNLDDPADTTIYAAITNLSGITSSISVNLTILQLEA